MKLSPGPICRRPAGRTLSGALLEGLRAEVVMADAAYDADHLRQTSGAKGALAVIPSSAAPNYRAVITLAAIVLKLRYPNT
jgi:transposase